MRILHVIPTIAARYGGTSTAVIPLVEALNRCSDVVVELATTDADGPDRYHRDQWAGRITKLHMFPAVGGARYSRSPQLNEWLVQQAREYDVIHTHSMWNSFVFAARKAANSSHRPIVFTPHGMLSAYSWARNRPLKYAYWFARERGNVRSAAVIHCTSEREAADVRAHRAVRGQVEIIPNGVDAEAWTVPVDPNALRRRCGPAADGKPIILFLSRLHPVKGVTDLLLPAFSRLDTPAYLAIIGGPDERDPGYVQQIRHEIERLGLANRVGLLGPVPAAERWAMFDGADVFALPSRSENFGIVVAEAMARGCPVLVTDSVQSCEHVVRASAGVVTPTSVSGVAEGLNEILTRGRAAWGTKAREYAQRHFNWDHVAKALVGVYSRLLNRK